MLRKIYNVYFHITGLFSEIFNRIIFKIMKVEVKGKYRINGRIFLRNSGTFILGKSTVINSGFQHNPIGGQEFMSIVVKSGGLLEIKNNVGISNSAIYCTQKIIIDEDVIIGGDCKIYDTDFHSIYLKDRLARPEVGAKSSPVKINKGAFIGTGTIILKGVEIGENTIIGAGSIVSKNIPANEIWGGNPIAFIKKIK